MFVHMCWEFGLCQFFKTKDETLSLSICLTAGLAPCHVSWKRKTLLTLKSSSNNKCPLAKNSHLLTSHENIHTFYSSCNSERKQHVEMSLSSLRTAASPTFITHNLCQRSFNNNTTAIDLFVGFLKA